MKFNEIVDLRNAINSIDLRALDVKESVAIISLNCKLNNYIKNYDECIHTLSNKLKPEKFDIIYNELSNYEDDYKKNGNSDYLELDKVKEYRRIVLEYNKMFEEARFAFIEQLETETSNLKIEPIITQGSFERLIASDKTEINKITIIYEYLTVR